MNFKIVFAKFITLIVALQILNVSIYAQDMGTFQQQNVIAYNNEINSVAEYIGEVVLKHANSFPEYPNDGHKNIQGLKHIDINTFSFPPYKVKTVAKVFTEYTAPHSISYSYLFFKEINPPPPKA